MSENSVIKEINVVSKNNGISTVKPTKTYKDEDSGLVRYARDELERSLKAIKKNDDESGYKYQKAVYDDVLDMVKLFSYQGHSGFSAACALGLLKNLLDFKPISPLTGDDDEWNDVYDNVQQNKRCSSVFRENKDNSTAHDIDRFSYSDNGGLSWFGGGSIARKLGIKETIEFPYVPGSRQRIYIKYLSEHDEKNCTEMNFVDISNDKEEIEKLRERKLKERESDRK